MKRKLFLTLSILCLTFVFVFLAAGTVSAKAETITVPVGKSVTVNYSTSNTFPYRVTSSDESILKVSLSKKDFDGRNYHYSITYTGVARGKATAAVYTNPGYGADKVIYWEVKVVAPVKKITLNRSKATLTRTATEKKPTLKLTATVSPLNADIRTVVWSSSDTKVATVSGNGKVTAHKKGQAVITCRAKDGSGVEAKCTITVTNLQVTKIILNKEKASIKTGKTLQLKVKTIKPAAALNQKVEWTSSDKKVATVDKNGLVTAKGPGKCVITCTAADGSGKKATCKITVK